MIDHFGLADLKAWLVDSPSVGPWPRVNILYDVVTAVRRQTKLDRCSPDLRGDSAHQV